METSKENFYADVILMDLQNTFAAQQGFFH